MSTNEHIRAAAATILGLIFIPWLITDPHWRNVLLCFVGLYVLYVMTERDEMLLPGKKPILITGCDTGFGHGMAKYFDRQGFRVFAGCLTSEGEGAKELQSTCSESLKVLQLDVTKDEEIDNALQTVKEDLEDEGKSF
ncbi:estradiol 17-beta-dehydrogenase 2-like [Amphiura filiformis]|uniref:estradiol 17-beta-dehydrogenase 2-like n=1 Tax=Amphiura filiformis TaxID=82378 RepID=UPI003B2204EA